MQLGENVIVIHIQNALPSYCQRKCSSREHNSQFRHGNPLSLPRTGNVLPEFTLVKFLTVSLGCYKLIILLDYGKHTSSLLFILLRLRSPWPVQYWNPSGASSADEQFRVDTCTQEQFIYEIGNLTLLDYILSEDKCVPTYINKLINGNEGDTTHGY